MHGGKSALFKQNFVPSITAHTCSLIFTRKERDWKIVASLEYIERSWLKRKKQHEQQIISEVTWLPAYMRKAGFEIPNIYPRKLGMGTLAYNISTREHRKVVPSHSLVSQTIQINELHT